MKRFAHIYERVLKQRLIAISFITGFALLAYELAAARVLAPSIGSSTYVWTSVIGTIIAALSLGFFVGGRLADRRKSLPDVAYLLLLAALMAAGTLVLYQDVLVATVDSFSDNRIQALAAALVLFAPTSFFIGMTSPYLAKLNVRSLQQTGRSIANLDMMNAIGGIIGTFVTGFILFGYIGSNATITLVVVLLLATSWMVAPRVRTAQRAILTGVVLMLLFTPQVSNAGAISIDTPSANYRVNQGFYGFRPVTGLSTGPFGTQSAVYKDGSSEPVFWYAKTMAALAIERKPDSVLVLGGGAFTLPQYLSERLPETSIDVVEIDPELLTISRDHFNYKDPANVNEVFNDARTYINQTEKKYDMILVDVYGDASIPFSLMTKEYGLALAERLKSDGVVLANFIAGWNGECRKVFAALDASYRQKLPFVSFANESGLPEVRANHVVAYSRQPTNFEDFSPLTDFDNPPYTDDFAPAERLYYGCEQATTNNS